MTDKYMASLMSKHANVMNDIVRRKSPLKLKICETSPQLM